MKRDMDLMREILLKIEASDRELRLSDLLGKNPKEVEEGVRNHYVYQIDQLHQGNLIKGIQSKLLTSTDWLHLALTPKGHDFLDNTRNSKVWELTKEALKKLGGYSVDIAVAVAKDYAIKLATGKLP